MKSARRLQKFRSLQRARRRCLYTSCHLLQVKGSQLEASATLLNIESVRLSDGVVSSTQKLAPETPLKPAAQARTKGADSAAAKGKAREQRPAPKPRKAAAKAVIVDDTETEGDGVNDQRNDQVLN